MLKKQKATKKQSKGSWHYQIVHRKLHNGEDWFAIHEAHLNADGEIFAITEEPMPAQAGTVAGVKEELKHMLEDLEEYGVFEHDGSFAEPRKGKSVPFKWPKKKTTKKKRSG